MTELPTDATRPQKVKYLKLAISLVIDALGMASYLFPGQGELADLVWGPISGAACFLMYRGRLGLIGGAFAAAEEMLPFTDIIPSLTLVWLCRYVLSGEK